MRFTQPNRLFLVLAAALSVAFGGMAFAHHDPLVQYGGGHTLDIVGTVEKVEWTNPHAYVHVRANVKGSDVIYRIELQGLPGLAERGWTGTELKIGEKVKVTGYLEKKEGSTQACCAHIRDMAGREFYTGRARAEDLNNRTDKERSAL